MKPLMHAPDVNETDKVDRFKFDLSYEFKRLRLLGWDGGVGVILLLIALFLILVLLLPGLRNIEQLEQSLADLKTTNSIHPIQTEESTVSQKLSDFYAVIPTDSIENKPTKLMLNTAKNYGIHLEQVEYLLKKDKVTLLSKYLISIPMRGDYIKIRLFVIDLLNAMPSAAINELSFRREDGNAKEVEASLRMTIYMKQSL